MEDRISALVRVPTAVAWADDEAWPLRLPRRVWDGLRLGVLAATLGLVALLLGWPELGLDVFWSAFVPTVPVLLLLAPGVWRNLCPLATLNQAPRRGGRVTERVLPAAFAMPAGMAMAVTLIAGRKFVFNISATATAGLIAGALLLAFVGGLFFRGKSGWCSSLCPMLPVERLYGQSPWLRLGNSHCAPCVGCAQHCPDLRPLAAAYTEVDDEAASGRASLRRLFAGIFPGLVAAYFLLPDVPVLEPAVLARKMVAYLGASLLAFQVIDHLAGRRHTLAVMRGFAALAFSLYYVMGWPHWLSEWTGDSERFGPLGGLLGAAFTGLAAAWWWRAWRRDRRHEAARKAPGTVIRVHPTPQPALPAPVPATPAPAPAAAQVVLEGEPATPLAWPRGLSLLDALEQAGAWPGAAGCRVGQCGSDLVCVGEGAGQLEPAGEVEQATLRRMGAGEGVRLACMARCGDAPKPIHVRTAAGSPAFLHRGAPSPGTDAAPPAAPAVDPDLRAVVIVGSGVAGITVADEVRRRHPDCAIHLIGRESRPAYNRMAIADLISCGRSVQGLLLRPAAWYVDHHIQTWINTQARAIDRSARELVLATGERLAYDRLVLATGAEAWRPPIDQIELPGSHVLRDADDAIAIRAEVQRVGARQAVVIGSGPLGLEAAQALRALGLSVTVLSLGRGLMEPLLDAPASSLLARSLARLGVVLEYGVEAEAVCRGETGRAAGVRARDGRTWPAEVVLTCAGTRPQLTLAREAGLAVGEGILVDDGLRTSDPHIYAVGDVAEFQCERTGLWPAALEQARIAARTLLGEDAHYAGHLPVLDLKVEGAQVCVVGRVAAQGDAVSSCSTLDEALGIYVKLVVERGRLVGAVLVGPCPQRQALVEAVRAQVSGREVDALLGLAAPAATASP